MGFFKKVPMAITGLALALAALGNLLQTYGDWVRYTCGILSAIILVVFVLKLIFDWENVKNELKNPVVLSSLPTATMALMLLTAYVKPFWGVVAVCIWYAAIVLQLLIMALFVKQFVIGFKLQSVFPSWFIAAVGIVTATVTSPAMDAKPFGQVIFYAGLVLYFVTAALVICRMIKVKPIPEPARPTIAIFTAPMSLLLAGYMQAFDIKSAFMVWAMLIIAAASYLYVTVKMIWLLRLKFYPTYAAFTFPYVISAVAFKAANNFLVQNGHEFFKIVPDIALWVAVAMVAYVVVRYIIFLATPKPLNAPK